MKQSSARRWQKQNPRKQTKQEQEDSQNTRESETNRYGLIYHLCLPRGLTSLHCLIECELSHTEFPGTILLGVDWYWKCSNGWQSISHSCISIFNLELQTQVTGRCGVEGGGHNCGRIRVQRETKEMSHGQRSPCGKTHSFCCCRCCCCWPQQNSWEEAGQNRHVSHQHSLPLVQIEWLKQKRISAGKGTATDGQW